MRRLRSNRKAPISITDRERLQMKTPDRILRYLRGAMLLGRCYRRLGPGG
jgi:hypothetical protein